MKKIALFLVAMLLLSYSVVFADIIAPQDDPSGEVTVSEVVEPSGEVESAIENVTETAPSGTEVQEQTNTSSSNTEPVETAKSPSPLGAIIAIVVVIAIVALVAFISK